MIQWNVPVLPSTAPGSFTWVPWDALTSPDNRGVAHSRHSIDKCREAMVVTAIYLLSNLLGISRASQRIRVDISRHTLRVDLESRVNQREPDAQGGDYLTER
jgi:hypothetical protein